MVVYPMHQQGPNAQMMRYSDLKAHMELRPTNAVFFLGGPRESLDDLIFDYNSVIEDPENDKNPWTGCGMSRPVIDEVLAAGNQFREKFESKEDGKYLYQVGVDDQTAGESGCFRVSYGTKKLYKSIYSSHSNLYLVGHNPVFLAKDANALPYVFDGVQFQAKKDFTLDLSSAFGAAFLGLLSSLPMPKIMTLNNSRAYVTSIKYARSTQTCSFADLIGFRAVDIVRREFESKSQEFPLVTQLIADCEASIKENEEQSKLWAASFCNAFYRQLKKTYWSAWPCCCINLIGTQRSTLATLATRVSGITKATHDPQLVESLTSLFELSFVTHVTGDRRKLCARTEVELKVSRTWQSETVQLLAKERALEAERKQQEEMIRLASSPPPVFYVIVQNQPPAPCAYPEVKEEKSDKSNPYYQPVQPNPYQENAPVGAQIPQSTSTTASNPYQDQQQEKQQQQQQAPNPTAPNPYQDQQPQEQKTN